MSCFYVKLERKQTVAKKNKLKVIYFDMENSRMIVEFPTYSLYGNDKIDPKYIKKDWHFTCGAWASLDLEKKKIGPVKTVSVLDDQKRFKKDHRDDYHVVKTMHNVLKDADMIIGHNSKTFDWKKLNYRFVIHGLEALDEPVHIDTLKAARKYYRSTSNSLFFLAKEFGVEMKDALPAGVMHKADEGCVKSLKRLVAYNKQDIKAGASLYFKMMPYIKNHPDIRRIMGKISSPTEGRNTRQCGTCGSTDVVSYGIRANKLGKYRRIKCRSCGATTQQRLVK